MSGPGWAVRSVEVPALLEVDLSQEASGALNPALPGTLVTNGGFDFELVFIPSENLGASSFEVLSMEGPETAAGTPATRILYDAPTATWNVVLLGIIQSDLQLGTLTSSNQVARAGDEVRLRLSWWPTHGLASFEASVNGLRTTRKAQVPGATLMREPTSLYLGRTVAGTSLMPAQWMSFKSVPLFASAYTRPAEVVFVGDSMLASLTLEQFGSTNAVGALLYTATEYASRLGVASLAYPGHTIAAQLASWDASRFVGDGLVRAVVIQLGLNDIITGRTLVQCRADYQALVDTIATDCPDAHIVACVMPPCKGYPAIASNFATFTGLNESIAGTSVPITGIHTRISSHYAAMCTSVPDFLDAALQVPTPDDLHQNNAGRLINVAPIRAALVAAGVFN